jgi:hypothetical protein
LAEQPGRYAAEQAMSRLLDRSIIGISKNTQTTARYFDRRHVAFSREAHLILAVSAGPAPRELLFFGYSS